MINEIVEESKTQKFCTLIAQFLVVELTNQLRLINLEIDSNPTPERLATLEFYKASIPYETIDVDGVDTDVAVVFDQRALPVVGDEGPLLNVVVVMSKLNDLHTRSTISGDVRYSVEGWQLSQTIGEQRGDTLAAKKLTHLLILCAKLLSSKKDLGGADRVGYIECSDLIEAQPDWGANNADNAIYGKFDCSVKIAEEVPRHTGGALIEGSETTLKINTTDKGYYWSVTY